MFGWFSDVMQTPAPANTGGQIDQVVIGVATDAGKVRSLNEDSFALPFGIAETQIAAKGVLVLVADGVGGHQAGEVASALAARAALDHYYASSSDDMAESLRYAVLAARTVIQQAQAQNPEQSDMGSTLVMAVIRGEQLAVANVGDSRCYRLRGAQITQLSRDHSWVGDQVRAGVLTDDEARKHVYRSIVNRALGRANIPAEPEVNIFDWQPADRLLLCSDGLWDALKDPQIATLLTISSGDAESIARGLVRTAKEADGSDNITAIVVCGPEAQLSIAVPQASPSVVRSGNKLWQPLLLVILAALIGLGAWVYGNGWPSLRRLPATIGSTGTVIVPIIIKATNDPTDQTNSASASATPFATVTLSAEGITVTVPTATTMPEVLVTATLSPTIPATSGVFLLCNTSDFDISRNVCKNTRNQFEIGTQTIYVYWSKPVVPNGADIKVIWSREDEVIYTQTCVVRRKNCGPDDIAPMWAQLSLPALTSSSIVNIRKTPTPRNSTPPSTAVVQPGLATGQYRVQLFINEEMQYDESFVIGATTDTPTP